MELKSDPWFYDYQQSKMLDLPSHSVVDIGKLSEGAEHAEEASEKKTQGQSQGSRSSWKDLFVFSTSRQLWVLPCALATACAAAAGKAVYTILLGKIFDVVSKFGAGALDGDEALAQVSQWCAYLCTLGIGFWIFNGLDMVLWMVSGELRAKSARETLLSSLLLKEMEWYDSREDGMASLMIRIQT